MFGSSIVVPMPAAIDAAIVAVRHALHVHHFLVVGAVVVHDAQQRNAVMRRGPQHAGRVHQVAVVLDVDRQPAVLLVGERRAHRRRRAVADAGAARCRRCTDSACRSSTAAAASC